MTRRNISSGSRFEEFARYSRAVVDGDWIFASGTVGADPVTGVIPEEAGQQTRMIISIISATLEQAGATLKDVVRCRVFITAPEYVEAVVKVLAEVFADIRPANTTTLCQLPAPGAKVEIEVTAHLRGEEK